MVTTDIILFTIQNDDLKVLLVKRRFEPFQDEWAIPGGFVKKDETLEQTALRELKEETNVDDVYLEQLYTFGSPNRDPRGRVITVSYFALANSKNMHVQASSDAKEVKWFSMYRLPKLAFDHKEILEYALTRLRYKLEYTAVTFKLLSEKFTLTDLQRVYEIILNKELDKRNFRKSIANLVKKTNEKTEGVSHRPAWLYEFKFEDVSMVHKK